MNPRYETLTIPGTPAEYRYTMVDARVLFRFAGEHTQASAIAEAESRLSLLPGIEITDMGSRAPMADTADLTVVDAAEPVQSPDCRATRRRVALALDVLAGMYAHGDVHHKDRIIDDVIRALTGADTATVPSTSDGVANTYPAWLDTHPAWRDRMVGGD